MRQSDDVLVPDIRVRKYKLIPKVWEVCCSGIAYSYETEDDDDTEYGQVPTRKFKIINCKIIRKIFYLFWTSLYSTDRHFKQS